jgi:hypothetical protein
MLNDSWKTMTIKVIPKFALFWTGNTNKNGVTIKTTETPYSTKYNTIAVNA